jgi:IS5 family transposase
MSIDSVVMNPVRSWAIGRLEPCAGKLACTVLRGEHAGNGVLLPDGKARKPYEFGVKVSLVVTHKQGFMACWRRPKIDPPLRVMPTQN